MIYDHTAITQTAYAVSGVRRALRSAVMGTNGGRWGSATGPMLFPIRAWSERGLGVTVKCFGTNADNALGQSRIYLGRLIGIHPRNAAAQRIVSGADDDGEISLDGLLVANWTLSTHADRQVVAGSPAALVLGASGANTGYADTVAVSLLNTAAPGGAGTDWTLASDGGVRVPTAYTPGSDRDDAQVIIPDLFGREYLVIDCDLDVLGGTPIASVGFVIEPWGA
jgi:hypothetical protein